MQHLKRHPIPLPRLTCFAAFHGQAFAQPVISGDGTQHLSLGLCLIHSDSATSVVSVLVTQHQYMEALTHALQQG